MDCFFFVTITKNYSKNVGGAWFCYFFYVFFFFIFIFVGVWCDLIFVLEIHCKFFYERRQHQTNSPQSIDGMWSKQKGKINVVRGIVKHISHLMRIIVKIRKFHSINTNTHKPTISHQQYLISSVASIQLLRCIYFFSDFSL